MPNQSLTNRTYKGHSVECPPPSTARAPSPPTYRVPTQPTFVLFVLFVPFVDRA